MNMSDAVNTFMRLYDAFIADKNEEIYEIFNNGFKIPESNKISLLGIAADHGNAELICYLLDNKILNVNEQDDLHYYTALHQAAMNNDDFLTQILLSYGADPNIRCDNGRTPLHIAVQHNYLNVIIALIESGKIDIDGKDGYGETALREALHRGYINIVLLLLEYGADPNIQCDIGCTLLHFYTHCIHNNINVNDRINVLAALIASGKIDINAKSACGNTVLHEALYRDYIDLILLLLDNNIFLDVNIKDSQGNIPLHIALSHDISIKIIRAILEKTTDVNIKNSQGNTPLHIALSNNINVMIIHELLEKGADVNAKDKFGNTLIDVARKCKNDKIMELLTAKTFKQIGNDEMVNEYIKSFEMEIKAENEFELKRQQINHRFLI